VREPCTRNQPHHVQHHPNGCTHDTYPWSVEPELNRNKPGLTSLSEVGHDGRGSFDPSLSYSVFFDVWISSPIARPQSPQRSVLAGFAAREE
jgi:hypothetical protein